MIIKINKSLKFHNMAIIIRCIFSESGKIYPQLFLDDTLYELNAYIFFIICFCYI